MNEKIIIVMTSSQALDASRRVHLTTTQQWLQGQEPIREQKGQHEPKTRKKHGPQGLHAIKTVHNNRENEEDNERGERKDRVEKRRGRREESERREAMKIMSLKRTKKATASGTSAFSCLKYKIYDAFKN